VENHFIKFAEVLRRENGRLEFSVENSRNPTSCQISQSSKEVTSGRFLQVEAQEREGRIFMPTRTVGFTREIPFRGFVGGKTETSSFGFTKLRSSIIRQGRRFHCGVKIWTRVGIQAFQHFGV
jgi:hypothetical protein